MEVTGPAVKLLEKNGKLVVINKKKMSEQLEIFKAGLSIYDPFKDKRYWDLGPYYSMGPEDQKLALEFILEKIREHDDPRGPFTLVTLGRKDLVPFLQEQYGLKTNEITKLWIARSIFELTGDPPLFLDSIRKCFRSENPEVRLEAAHLLDGIGIKEMFTTREIFSFFEKEEDPMVYRRLKGILFNKLPFGRIFGKEGTEAFYLSVKLGTRFNYIREPAIEEFRKVLFEPEAISYAYEFLPDFEINYQGTPNMVDYSIWVDDPDDEEFEYPEVLEWVKNLSGYDERWFRLILIRYLNEQSIRSARLLIDLDHREAVQAFKDCLEFANKEEFILELKRGIGKWEGYPREESSDQNSG